MLIDWHSHHTAGESAEEIGRATGKKVHIDAYDSPDFGKRVKELDAVGIDLQLICQGAGLNADQFPVGAMALVKKTNDIIAERISPYRDRLAGVISVSLQDIKGSVEEIDRMAGKGFRAVLLYPRVGAEVVLDTPAADQPTRSSPRSRSRACRFFSTGWRRRPIRA
jgi:predicted TIM-barrel fold metal-dependent hydrolase